MKGTGPKISSMGKVKRHGLMELPTTATMCRARRMVLGALFGLIDQLMTVHLLITTLMEKVPTHGQMEGNTLANGNKTRWKAEVSLLFLMAEDMKESIAMIIRKATLS